MAELIEKLLFALARFVAAVLMNLVLSEAVQKAGVWLDTKIQGRRTKFFIGGLCGIAAYFLFPVLTSLLS